MWRRYWEACRRGPAGVCRKGEEVRADSAHADPETADLPLVLKLLEWGHVYELLPVGSRGILFEANLLAASAGGKLLLEETVPVDMKKSAGPATCLLAALDPRDVDLAAGLTGKPLALIGTIR